MGSKWHGFVHFPRAFVRWVRNADIYYCASAYKASLLRALRCSPNGSAARPLRITGFRSIRLTVKFSRTSISFSDFFRLRNFPGVRGVKNTHPRPDFQNHKKQANKIRKTATGPKNFKFSCRRIRSSVSSRPERGSDMDNAPIVPAPGKGIGLKTIVPFRLIGELVIFTLADTLAVDKIAPLARVINIKANR